MRSAEEFIERLNLVDAKTGAQNLVEFLGAGSAQAVLKDEELAGTPFRELIEDCRRAGAPRQAELVKKWVATAWRSPHALEFLRLFHEGHSGAEKLVSTFFRDRASDDTFPYLHVFLLVLCGLYRKDPRVNELLGKRDADWGPVILDLVNDTSVPEFVLSLPQPLRAYGGAAVTTKYFYDPYFRGLSEFNLRAEFRGDLGGGFHTSEINRIMAAEFVSLDIQPPLPRDREYTPFFKQMNGVRLLMTEEERRDYFARQEEVSWKVWNVLEEQPFQEIFGDYDSYSFVSTAFLTSTVRPFSSESSISMRPWQDTFQFTCQRIMELVALGKDVSLFTIEGATSERRHFKTVMLRWCDGRVVAWKAMPQIDDGYWGKTAKRKMSLTLGLQSMGAF